MLKLAFFLPICLVMTLVYAATRRDRPVEIIAEALKLTLALTVAAALGSAIFYLISGG